MRVLVCGGRDYPWKETVYEALDMIHAQTPVTCIISGMARGADMYGAQWATDRGVKLEKYPAQWDKFGKMAGFVRNQQMLDEGRPDRVVAFAGGRGTADMVRRARLYFGPRDSVMEVKP